MNTVTQHIQLSWINRLHVIYKLLICVAIGVVIPFWFPATKNQFTHTGDTRMGCILHLHTILLLVLIFHYSSKAHRQRSR